jgi:hypothetical protein
VIVGLSAVAEWGRWGVALACAAIAGQGMAVVSIHPCELSYFNAVAGGPAGGRLILADSNLDWGQGARSLARLQRARPEFRDLTLYYFGDTDPAYYGVVGTRFVLDASDTHPGLPPTLEANSRFVGVSTSLQFGPWGPAGYFRALDGETPVFVLKDGTIAIYETHIAEQRRILDRTGDVNGRRLWNFGCATPAAADQPFDQRTRLTSSPTGRYP